MAKKLDPRLLEMTVDALAAKYGVDKSGDCWLWTRSLDGSGYGNLSVGGRMWRAHRLFYFAAFGVEPAGGVVMHKCDTPRCVNPRHLVLGSQRDNIADRHAKGRNGARRGEDASWSHLTGGEVTELRELFDQGCNRRWLMEKYGISKSQMYRVIRRESWRHI